MPKEDIQQALRNYNNDSDFGGNGKMLMQNVVNSLTEDQGDAIISYVLGNKIEKSNTNVKEEEPPSSYLQ